MKKIKAIIASLALFAMFAGTAAQAKVEIQWWHAFGGRLGELLDEQVNKYYYMFILFIKSNDNNSSWFYLRNVRCFNNYCCYFIWYI